MAARQTIGDRVRTQRKQLGLRQADLATKARVDQSRVSRIESGVTKRPRADELVRIARALGVSSEWLVAT